MGRLIIIEGTDCSGKETQSNMLYERMVNSGKRVFKFQFPMYDTPTGMIIGGSYLGKEGFSKPLFPEGAGNVPMEVSSLYFAADRKYNIPKIKELLDDGFDIILDRYVESNMACQGGKILDKEERLKKYEFIDKLEYGLLELPRPDIVLFLYVPYEKAKELKKNRNEAPDQLECDIDYLKNAETAYLELCALHNYIKIDCVKDNELRTIESINEEMFSIINK